MARPPRSAVVVLVCGWVCLAGSLVLALIKDRAAKSHEQDAIQWLAQPISLEIKSLPIHDVLNRICKTSPCDLRINSNGDIIIRPAPIKP